MPEEKYFFLSRQKVTERVLMVNLAGIKKLRQNSKKGNAVAFTKTKAEIKSLFARLPSLL